MMLSDGLILASMDMLGAAINAMMVMLLLVEQYI